MFFLEIVEDRSAETLIPLIKSTLKKDPLYILIVGNHILH